MQILIKLEQFEENKINQEQDSTTSNTTFIDVKLLEPNLHVMDQILQVNWESSSLDKMRE